VGTEGDGTGGGGFLGPNPFRFPRFGGWTADWRRDGAGAVPHDEVSTAPSPPQDVISPEQAHTTIKTTSANIVQ